MLKSIKLENFRNHKRFELDLSYSTVIVGQNGIGKTNVLEGFSILSSCRSFRSEDKRNIINLDKEYCRVTGDGLEVFISRFPRLSLKTKINQVPKKVSDFIGYLPAVVFSPETVSIITGSPGDRRRFLDVMISQSDKEYLVSLMNFKKIRQQRNNLLQRIVRRESMEAELSFWDDEFCKESKVILEKRGEAIKFLNQSIGDLYKQISTCDSDILKIKYHKNFEGDLKQNLLRNRARELGYGGTIFGPHRDDLVFELNAKNMANFASRGELKSAILALKVAEIKFLETRPRYDQASFKPLLLLDDIFSEFDPERRKHLSKLILNYQSVITSTEKENLPEELLKEAKVVELK